MVEHAVRDREVAGSSPTIPTLEFLSEERGIRNSYVLSLTKDLLLAQGLTTKISYEPKGAELIEAHT